MKRVTARPWAGGVTWPFPSRQAVRKNTFFDDRRCGPGVVAGLRPMETGEPAGCSLPGGEAMAHHAIGLAVGGRHAPAIAERIAVAFSHRKPMPRLSMET